MKHSVGHAILVGAMAVACTGTMAGAQQKGFALSSTTFKDDQLMPVKVGNSRANDPQNPNCIGENVSPQLSWLNPPAGTKSFALLMTDPEGHGGAGVNHWVAYGIAPDVTGFAEGEVSKPSSKYVGGTSRQGVGYFSGPCAPASTQPRHYMFLLIATDFAPNELPPGLTKEELTAKIAPPEPAPRREKGSAWMFGLFLKPAN